MHLEFGKSVRWSLLVCPKLEYDFACTLSELYCICVSFWQIFYVLMKSDLCVLSQIKLYL